MIAQHLVLPLALFCASCVPHTNLPAQEPLAIGDHSPEPLLGLWQSDAPGWILAIARDGATLYDITSVHCSKDPVLPLREMYAQGVLFGAAQLRLYETGKDTFEVFRRIDRLPKRCETKPPAGPIANFEAFAAIFAEHYPFFAQHGIDWNERVAAARRLVGPGTSESELFVILSGMLEGLNDGHVRLFGEVAGEHRVFVPYPGPTLAVTDADDVALRASVPEAPRFLSRYRASVLENVLDGDGTSTANGLMVYGRVGPDKDIGYINLIAFDGLAKGGWVAQRKAIVAAVGEAIASFADTRAMIFDVSNNRGGVSIAAQAAAGFFTDRPRTVASLSRPGQQRQAVTIVPRKPYYSKPVYVLTSNVTVSGGETFTLSMRAFPQVLHIGERTRGAMSKILPKTLPNGWTLYLSNQSYYDGGGNLWEGQGIPPQEGFNVFDRSNPDRGHVQAVMRTIAFIDGSRR